jgi:glycosyltransferase involved in cell wall biosynthesis
MLTARFLPTIGGAQIHVSELSRALVALGFEITIVAEKSTRGNSFMEKLNAVKIRRAPIRMYRGLLFPAYVVTALINELRGRGIVHAHFAIPCGLVGLLLKGIFRVPLVITVHGTDIVKAPEVPYGIRVNPFFDLLTKLILRRADHVIACSEFTHRLVLECGVISSKTSVISNGIASVDRKKMLQAAMSSRRIRDEIGVGPEALLLLTVGRLVPQKGMENLISAMAILKKLTNAHAVVAGDGPLRARLEQLARDLGVSDHVTFLGEVNPTELPRLYLASDMVLIPSIVEAFGLPAVEAMAYHRPTITFDSGGPSEIVRREGTGIVVDQRSPEALAESVMRLARDGTMAEQIRTKCEHAALAYNWNSIAQQTKQVYDSLCKPCNLHS